jgi:hypothetical protein
MRTAPRNHRFGTGLVGLFALLIVGAVSPTTTDRTLTMRIEDGVERKLPVARLHAPGTPTSETPPAAGALAVDIAQYGGCNGGNVANAVQNAVNAVPSSGGTVIFSCMADIGAPGVRVDNKRNVVFQGSNNGGIRSIGRTTLGNRIGNPFSMALYNCDQCRVENMRFDGNFAPVLSLSVQDSDDTIIQNNTFWNVTPAGLVWPCADCSVGGVITAANNRRNRYLNNTITNVGSNAGMWLGNPGAEYVEWFPTVSGNNITGTRATSIAGHSVSATISNNTVRNNFCCAGIKVVPENNNQGVAGTVLVEGNQLIDNGVQGFQVDFAGSQNFSGMNFIFRNNHVQNSGHAGFYGASPLFKNVTITGNTIVNSRSINSTGGIQLHGGDNVEISNNTIRDTRSGGARTQLHGVAMQVGTYTNVRIFCNRIENHPGHGMGVWGGTVSNWQITSNTIINNTQYGLFIQPGTSVSGVSASNNAYSGNGGGAAFNVSAGIGSPSCGGVAPPPPPPQRIWGDLNGDRIVNSADALIVLASVTGLPTGNADVGVADVNADSRVSSTDALIILYHAVGFNTGSARVGTPVA